MASNPPASTGGGVSFSFGQKGAAPPASSTPSLFSTTKTTSSAAPAKPTQPAGFTFGAPAASTGPTLTGSQSTGTVPATANAATGLGATSAPSLSLTTPASSTATSKVTIGTTTTSAPTSTAPSTVASTSSASTPSMTYKELEDQMNKWWMELDHQEKVFLEQATKVNAWDKVLIENGQKITSLNSDVEKISLDQHRLTNELDFILAQQKELEEMLVPLEENVSKLPPINYQQHTDSEREHTYQIAENIDAQLKRMTEDLKEVIDHLNAGSGSQDSSDPMLQISKILNAHMESLQWVDQHAAVLQKKTEEVARYADVTKKEHERNFRLAFS